MRAPGRLDQGPVEEPSRAPSVQILNPEDKRDRENGASDHASDRDRPVVEVAKHWLQSLQWIGVEALHRAGKGEIPCCGRGASTVYSKKALSEISC